MRGRHNYGLMSRWGEIGDLDVVPHGVIEDRRGVAAFLSSPYVHLSMSIGGEGVAVGVKSCAEHSAQRLIFIHPSTLAMTLGWIE